MFHSAQPTSTVWCLTFL